MLSVNIMTVLLDVLFTHFCKNLCSFLFCEHTSYLCSFHLVADQVTFLIPSFRIRCQRRSCVIKEALSGGLGNRGIRPHISGEQGNKSLKLKGTGKQRQFWETGNIESQDFDFGEQGKMPFFVVFCCCFFFQGNKGTGTPPPHHHLGGPHQSTV